MKLPIFFRVASLALGQWYDCLSAYEMTLKDMDQNSFYQTPTKHNKAQTCAHISGDVLCHSYVCHDHDQVSFIILHLHIWPIFSVLVYWYWGNHMPHCHRSNPEENGSKGLVLICNQTQQIANHVHISKDVLTILWYVCDDHDQGSFIMLHLHIWLSMS